MKTAYCAIPENAELTALISRGKELEEQRSKEWQALIESKASAHELRERMKQDYLIRKTNRDAIAKILDRAINPPLIASTKRSRYNAKRRLFRQTISAIRKEANKAGINLARTGDKEIFWIFSMGQRKQRIR
jgi:hypothetical protein